MEEHHPVHKTGRGKCDMTAFIVHQTLHVGDTGLIPSATQQFGTELEDLSQNQVISKLFIIYFADARPPV